MIKSLFMQVEIERFLGGWKFRVGVCASLIASLLLLDGCKQEKSSKPSASVAQADLMEFYSQLELGMGRTEVFKIWRHRERSLRMDIAARNSLILVETPTLLSEENWMLAIELREEKVKALLIRIADSGNIKPAQAPEDRIAPDFSLGQDWKVQTILED